MRSDPIFRPELAKWGKDSSAKIEKCQYLTTCESQDNFTILTELSHLRSGLNSAATQTLFTEIFLKKNHFNLKKHTLLTRNMSSIEWRKRWPIDRGGQIESHTANYTLMDIAADQYVHIVLTIFHIICMCAEYCSDYIS